VTAGPDAIHAMIEHLVRQPQHRGQVKQAPEELFEQFGVPQDHRAVLLNGSRDEISALGVHGNYVIKWLIWSGRPTMPFFAMSHFFDRR